MAQELEILAEGEAPYLPVDPDGFRESVRDHKDRSLRPKLMSEREAIERFVQDGDYLVYECNYLNRGPAALLREIMRQRKRDLWVGCKFTWIDVALLVEAGCATKIDVGFFLYSAAIDRAVKEGRVQLYEYSNVVMTNRLLAGAMGIPFIPVRSFGGTDGFKYSGAKLVRDPYSGQPVTIVPALNPDVAIIHVHQADIYGNARIYGVGISDLEAALASKKVIISTEEIVDTEEIRSDPGRTTIPYFLVNAVVHLPFGAYPGEMPGRYCSDVEHCVEVVGASMRGRLDQYLEKWVYGVGSHAETLDKLVGYQKLAQMVERATIKEGYGR